MKHQESIDGESLIRAFQGDHEHWQERNIDPRLPAAYLIGYESHAVGALGFWKAVAEVYPTTKEQRCWVHKTANVLDKLPKNMQPKAKGMIHEIWMADPRERHQGLRCLPVNLPGQASQGLRLPLEGPQRAVGFLRLPGRALEALADHQPDRVDLCHDSLAASSHQRQRHAGACLAMMFKLAQSADRGWRLLNGAKLLPDVLQGIPFKDGIRLDQAAA